MDIINCQLCQFSAFQIQVCLYQQNKVFTVVEFQKLKKLT